MKKLFLSTVAVLGVMFAGSEALAQSAPIFGQTSPGVYNPITANNGTPSNPLDVNIVGNGLNSYANITTSTTTLVKTGAGTLHTVNINSVGTVASSISIYDNILGSGTAIAVIDSLAVNSVGTRVFDISFTTGLTIVTTGTVAPNVTVSYK